MIKAEPSRTGKPHNPFWKIARIVISVYAILMSLLLQDYLNEDPTTRNKGSSANWLSDSLMNPPGISKLPTNAVFIAGTDFTYFAALFQVHCSRSPQGLDQPPRTDISVVSSSAMSNPEYLLGLQARYSPSTYVNVGFFQSRRDPDFMLHAVQPPSGHGVFNSIDRLLLDLARSSDRHRRLQSPTVRSTDIPDASGFVASLKSNRTAVDMSILEILQDLAVPPSEPDLSHRLTELMNSDSWYSPETFTNASIPQFLHDFALQNPSGLSRTILNRHLLSAMYPNYIASPISGTYPVQELSVPNEEVRRRIISTYSQDSLKRYESQQLRAGEYVIRHADGSVSVSGPAALDHINSELVQFLVRLNPTRSFLFDSSIHFPWLESHTTPHGPVVAYHPQPLNSIDSQTLSADRKWWEGATARLLGEPFARAVSVTLLESLLSNDPGHSAGSDKATVRNFSRSRNARRCIARLRLGSARSVYLARLASLHDPQSMEFWRTESELALQQALLLDPHHEPTFRTFIQFLCQYGRSSDAVWFLEARQKHSPKDSWLQTLRVEPEPSGSR